MSPSPLNVKSYRCYPAAGGTPPKQSPALWVLGPHGCPLRCKAIQQKPSHTPKDGDAIRGPRGDTVAVGVTFYACSPLCADIFQFPLSLKRGAFLHKAASQSLRTLT